MCLSVRYIVQNAMMVYDASMPVDLPHQFPPLTLHKVLCHSKAFFLRRLLSFTSFFPELQVKDNNLLQLNSVSMHLHAVGGNALYAD